MHFASGTVMKLWVLFQFSFLSMYINPENNGWVLVVYTWRGKKHDWLLLYNINIIYGTLSIEYSRSKVEIYKENSLK
ncbi:hypothetical protein AQUCO_06200052v1 [Aquilegia coerulea]|uniref:Uncharacterized protein n=1 Tax=Aquilegia coerulea TaxID=218851 RepID=A0A2G5CD49_AQUCA|nr:hypothetical protein AQUCO_06200052v1 [Aquilegia coerulea]